MTRNKQNMQRYRYNIMIMASLSLIYAVGFVILFPHLGTAVATFQLVPAVIIAWIFGLKIGFIYTIFILVVTDVILFPLVGLNATDVIDAGFVTGGIATLLAAVVVGRLHDLGEQLSYELSEKERAEGNLRDLSQQLESRVQERTAALEASEAYYRTLFQNSVMPIVIYDRNGIILNANNLAAKNMNTTPEVIIGKNIYHILPFETTRIFLERLQNVFDTGLGTIHEEPIDLPHETRWFLTNTQPIFDAEGNTTAVYVVAQDISDLKRTKSALTQSEQRWQFALEGSGDGIWDWNLDTDEIYFSDPWKEMLGYETDEFDNNLSSWGELFHPDDLYIFQAELNRLYSGETAVLTCEYRLRCQDSSYKWVLARGKVIETHEDNLPKRIIGTHTDITARKETEEMILNVARGVSAATGSYFFRALVAYLGKTLQADMAFIGELVEKDESEIHTIAVYADNVITENFIYPLLGSPCNNVVNRRTCVYKKDVYKLFPDDKPLADNGFEAYIGAPLFSADKSPLGLIAVLYKTPLYETEIAKNLLQIFAVRAAAELDRVRSEEALRQSEAKLRQAQKLEAIGQLAGGVAHDFNNILTVIISYSEMILRNQQEVSESVYQQVSLIKDAGERAAHITQQLLAFSRKQVLAPTILNLNTAVTRTVDMLEHLIGEHIELNLELDPDLWPCKADPSQIEQVILNLAINGRDAMPNGGQLTIKSKNLELTENKSGSYTELNPGKYVTLIVSDTGVGMDKKTQAQIFDPFFTTKDVDKGTGLGLATVHGIVSQSGGFISVKSKPHKGTTFIIHLPQFTQEAALSDIFPHQKTNKNNLNGNETILLVEDEASIRHLAQEILELYGYKVFTATSYEALNIFQSQQANIQMLLTDVVMPGINGPDLAEQILQKCPDLKVLYMSGYTDDFILLQGVKTKDVAFIQKPFTPKQLAAKTRLVLDTPPGIN